MLQANNGAIVRCEKPAVYGGACVLYSGHPGACSAIGWGQGQPTVMGDTTPPDPHFQMSVVIDGATFSASGPKSEVLRLYAEWKDLSGLQIIAAEPRRSPAFNAPRVATR